MSTSPMVKQVAGPDLPEAKTPPATAITREVTGAMIGLPKQEIPTAFDGIVSAEVEEIPEAEVQEALAKRAYYNWERRGRPIGSPLNDWMQAVADSDK